MTNTRLEDVHVIAKTIFNKKGFNIVVLDVRGVCSLTDFFIIAEGSVERHVRALGQTIIDQFEEMGESPMRIEGNKACDWLVLDFIDIIIHLFTPGLRERYAIERLWHEGKIVDVEYDME